MSQIYYSAFAKRTLGLIVSMHFIFTLFINVIFQSFLRGFNQQVQIYEIFS